MKRDLLDVHRTGHATREKHGKYPKLPELCRALDVSFQKEQAHSALYDATVLAHCITRGLQRGHFVY